MEKLSAWTPPAPKPPPPLPTTVTSVTASLASLLFECECVPAHLAESPVGLPSFPYNWIVRERLLPLHWLSVRGEERRGDKRLWVKEGQERPRHRGGLYTYVRAGTQKQDPKNTEQCLYITRYNSFQLNLVLTGLEKRPRAGFVIVVDGASIKAMKRFYLCVGQWSRLVDFWRCFEPLETVATPLQVHLTIVVCKLASHTKHFVVISSFLSTRKKKMSCFFPQYTYTRRSTTH